MTTTDPVVCQGLRLVNIHMILCLTRVPACVTLRGRALCWAGGPGLLVNTIVVATQAQNKVNLELNKFNLCKKEGHLPHEYLC